jgi:hypothetical protein
MRQHIENGPPAHLVMKVVKSKGHLFILDLKFAFRIEAVDGLVKS